MVALVAAADPLVPAKRFQVWNNTDLPKGDLSSIFDTTIDACERACLNNTRCEPLVFNTKANSCFLKAGTLPPHPFAGRYAAFVSPPVRRRTRGSLPTSRIPAPVTVRSSSRPLV